MMSNETPWFEAVAKNDFTVVKQLLASGIDINLRDFDNENRTALHVAATAGLIDMVILLVDSYGANFNIDDDFGDVPLHNAFDNNHSDIAKYLVGKESRYSEDCCYYQIKITLYEPNAWRRIKIQSDATFEDLHYAIQCSFDWHNDHMHEFCFENPASTGNKFSFPDNIITSNAKLKRKYWRARDRLKIGPQLPKGIKFYFDQEEFLTETEVKLFEVFGEDNRHCLYLYDFGDRWEHLVELEKVEIGLIQPPICIAGKGVREEEEYFDDELEDYRKLPERVLPKWPIPISKEHFHAQ